MSFSTTIKKTLFVLLFISLNLNAQNSVNKNIKGTRDGSKKHLKELNDKSLSQAISLELPEAFSATNMFMEEAVLQKENYYIASANNILGIVYHEIEEFDKSFYHYKVAKKLALKIKDTSLIIYTENNIGKKYEKYGLLQGNNMASFDLAIKQYEKALYLAKYFSNIKQDYQIYLNYNLGTSNFHARELYLKKGNLKMANQKFDQAMIFLNKADLLLRNQEGHYWEKSVGLEYKGCIYAYKKNYDSAKIYFDKAMRLCKKIENISLLNELFKYRSKFYNENGKFKESSTLIDSIIKYDKLENKRVYEQIIASSSEVFDFNSGKLQLEELRKREKVKEEEYKKILRYNSVFVILALVLLILGVLLYLKNNNLKEVEQMAIESLNRKIDLERKIEKIESNIAADLHDNFGNRINSLITTHNIIKDIRKNTNMECSEYDRFTGVLEANLLPLSNDIKDLLWANNAANNQLYLIIKRIAFICDERMKNNDTKINLSVKGAIKDKIILPKFANKQLLFIVKEALNNANKYSKSNKIDINISVSKSKTIDIEIKDYGIGFNIEKLKRVNGLSNMRKRAELIKFVFNITAKENKGTTIHLKSSFTLNS